MEVLRAKGTKEILFEEKIKRDKVISVIRNIFERYGFSPFETPTIQRFDVLASNGGSEILKETFKLKDQGGRDLALRYDLTVPMCIAIALNPNIKLPFKRYEIGKVFRDGPVETERVREFWQCDADVVGSKSVAADAECIKIYDEVFKTLKIDVDIIINSRKLLNDILKYCGLENKSEEVLIAIDKLDKIGLNEVLKEIEKVADKNQIEKLNNILKKKEDIDDLKKLLGETEGINEIKELQKFCKIMNVKFIFDVTLARGLSYYTGPIFEVRSKKAKSSLGGGGRYDKMIGNLLRKGDYPSTGMSFGLDRICMILNEDEIKSQLKVYVIPINQNEKAIEIVTLLRDSGINADLDVNEKAISKNLDYASKLGIPYVLFVGEQEVKANKFKLRDMKSGKEEMLKKEDLIKKLKWTLINMS